MRSWMLSGARMVICAWGAHPAAAARAADVMHIFGMVGWRGKLHRPMCFLLHDGCTFHDSFTMTDVAYPHTPSSPQGVGGSSGSISRWSHSLRNYAASLTMFDLDGAIANSKGINEK